MNERFDSGHSGLQATVHIRGKTECFECQPKQAPKTYPVCTIRNTPDKPIHCIVWAKDLLFQRLFGRWGTQLCAALPLLIIAIHLHGPSVTSMLLILHALVHLMFLTISKFHLENRMAWISCPQGSGQTRCNFG